VNTDQNSHIEHGRNAAGRRVRRRAPRVRLAVGAAALATIVPSASANAAIGDLSFTDLSYCYSNDGLDLGQYVGWRTTNAKPSEPIELLRTAYVDGNLVETFSFVVTTQFETVQPLAIGSNGRMTITTLDGQVLAETGTIEPCGTESNDPTTPDEPTDPSSPGEPTVPGEPTDPVIPAEPTEPVIPAEPTEPVIPAEPTEPVIPVETTESVIPGEPREPVMPVEPTEPVESTPTPVEPQPIAPAGPSSSSVGTALTTSPDRAPTGTLPETGRGSWNVAALASALTTAGLAMVLTGRRRATDSVGL
jgi:LPXTG-motif cell wall-anchored protein